MFCSILFNSLFSFSLAPRSLPLIRSTNKIMNWMKEKSFESLSAFHLLSHNKWTEITFLNFVNPAIHSQSQFILLMITISTDLSTTIEIHCFNFYSFYSEWLNSGGCMTFKSLSNFLNLKPTNRSSRSFGFKCCIELKIEKISQHIVNICQYFSK